MLREEEREKRERSDEVWRAMEDEARLEFDAWETGRGIEASGAEGRTADWAPPWG